MNLSSNRYLEDGDKYITPPDIADLNIKNPDDYITRLDQITAPTQRLKTLWLSAIDITTEPTYEAMWIRKLVITGTAAGFFAGAFFNSPDIHQDYIRQHNASVFDSKYVGNRHFWDTLAYRCAGRGFKYGFRSGALTTAAVAIGISSITYRNKLYLPDWLIGYTTLGALSRLWIGPRGMAAGGLIWLTLGMIGFGVFRGMEKMTGISISEFEYISHKQWLLVQQSKLNCNHLLKEQTIVEFIQDEITRE